MELTRNSQSPGLRANPFSPRAGYLARGIGHAQEQPVEAGRFLLPGIVLGNFQERAVQEGRHDECIFDLMQELMVIFSNVDLVAMLFDVCGKIS